MKKIDGDVGLADYLIQRFGGTQTKTEFPHPPELAVSSVLQVGDREATVLEFSRIVRIDHLQKVLMEYYTGTGHEIEAAWKFDAGVIVMAQIAGITATTTLTRTYWNKADSKKFTLLVF